MLDTNICSYIIKNKPIEILAKFKTLHIDDCCISVITYSELKLWVVRNNRLHSKSGNPGSAKVNEHVINNFTAHLNIIEFDSLAADICGEIRDYSESNGINVGNMDLLIAAHAISKNAILVTNNSKDFIKLPHLQLENWVR